MYVSTSLAMDTYIYMCTCVCACTHGICTCVHMHPFVYTCKVLSCIYCMFSCIEYLRVPTTYVGVVYTAISCFMYVL